jgi:DNA-binding FadR family transcriptional regulator
MSQPRQPIPRRKLADDVEERILDLIRRDGLKPGDPLPSERELMALYGVGRPAVREAMQNLQRMGLAEIKHGGRPRVATPSFGAMAEGIAAGVRHMLSHDAASMDHLKEARATFEVQMARIAAERRSGEDVARLRALLARQAALGADPQRFLECDGAFHAAVAWISGNPIFGVLSASVFDWLGQFHVDLVRKPGLEKLTIAEHGSIIDAIESGDADAAGRRMADHLNRANSLYHQSNLTE